MAQLCDNGCVATFTKSTVNITYNGHIVLSGRRNNDSGLWYLTTPQSPSSSPITESPSSSQTATTSLCYASEVITSNKVVLEKFYHHICFSPTLATFTKAINNNFFTTWPGLTTSLITKHLHKSSVTIKGHLRQQFKNIQSTKTPNSISTAMPSMTTSEVRTHWVAAQAIEVQGSTFSDQTGRFPITSSRGHKYIMVLYCYDANAIIAEPIKSRAESELVRAYSTMHHLLTSRGFYPQLHYLDNEAPSGLQQFITSHNTSFQLVPPHTHRRNAAEQSQVSEALIQPSRCTCGVVLYHKPSSPLICYSHPDFIHNFLPMTICLDRTISIATLLPHLAQE